MHDGMGGADWSLLVGYAAISEKSFEQHYQQASSTRALPSTGNGAEATCLCLHWLTSYTISLPFLPTHGWF